MLRPVYGLKVVWVIVSLLFVLVMDVLCGEKGTTKLLRHDKPGELVLLTPGKRGCLPASKTPLR